MSEWQPIETAPADATPVIIGSSAGVGEAWLSKGDHKWRWPDGELVIMAPTHWMPLPAPPITDSKSTD